MENLLGEEDEEGILKSQQVFHSWIESEEKSCGVKAENVVIGGFSQGGILSILAGLTHKAKIGGIFGLSSCLALRDKFQSLVPENNPNKVRYANNVIVKCGVLIKSIGYSNLHGSGRCRSSGQT